MNCFRKRRHVGTLMIPDTVYNRLALVLEVEAADLLKHPAAKHAPAQNRKPIEP